MSTWSAILDTPEGWMISTPSCPPEPLDDKFLILPYPSRKVCFADQQTMDKFLSTPEHHPRWSTFVKTLLGFPHLNAALTNQQLADLVRTETSREPPGDIIGMTRFVDSLKLGIGSLDDYSPLHYNLSPLAVKAIADSRHPQRFAALRYLNALNRNFGMRNWDVFMAQKPELVTSVWYENEVRIPELKEKILVGDPSTKEIAPLWAAGPMLYQGVERPLVTGLRKVFIHATEDPIFLPADHSRKFLASAPGPVPLDVAAATMENP